MNQRASEAAFHRAALLLGLTSGDAVIAWADDIIANDHENAAPFLDLSMIPPHDLSELRHALEHIATRTDSLGLLRALFDIARREELIGKRSAGDTITVLRQARSFLKLPDEYSLEIQKLDNDHMLARAGIEQDVTDVERRVRVWLAQFENAENEFFEESRC